MRHQDIPPRRPHHIVQRLSRNNTIMTRQWITARNMAERREQKIVQQTLHFLHVFCQIAKALSRIVTSDSTGLFFFLLTLAVFAWRKTTPRLFILGNYVNKHAVAIRCANHLFKKLRVTARFLSRHRRSLTLGQVLSPIISALFIFFQRLLLHCYVHCTTAKPSH